MVLAQALFAVMGVVGRIGSVGVPWQEVLFARFLIGALTALLVAKIRHQSLAVPDQRRQMLRTGFGTLAAIGTFFLLASPQMSLGDLVTVFGTSPVFVALMSWPLLGERVRGREWIAILLSFAGIVAVAQPALKTAPFLVIVGLLTAFSSALAMVFLRGMGPGASSEAIVFQFSGIGAVVALLLSIPVWKTPDLRGALYLLATGVTGGLAQIVMTRAYALDSAARISAIGYSSIVFTRLYALPVFGEVPTAVQLAGSLLVIVAGVHLAMSKKPAPL
jgi:drug/metabolite transporter (DMT)-like permease